MSDGSKEATRTDPAGLADVTTRRQDGTLVAELADGTVITSSDATDIPLTDPLSRTTQFFYDQADRPTRSVLANGREIAIGYDTRDNLTAIMPPGRTAHVPVSRPSLTTSQSYSGFGELERMAATYASTSLLEATYTRDGLGRIETKVEVLGGNTTTYAYTYDLTGRLTQVTADGVAVEAYAYDTNGNRTSSTGAGGVVAATFDAQDRLLTYGSNSYTYTAAGDLTSKVRGANTTGHTYDVLGNLLRVDLPDETAIEYVVDGAGRRTGRKVNGVLQEGWLYQDALKPGPIIDALKNPLRVTPVRVDQLGRPSQQFTGEAATVVRNPDTGQLITVWRTGSRLVERLKGGG